MLLQLIGSVCFRYSVKYVWAYLSVYEVFQLLDIITCNPITNNKVEFGGKHFLPVN